MLQKYGLHRQSDLITAQLNQNKQTDRKKDQHFKHNQLFISTFSVMEKYHHDRN